MHRGAVVDTQPARLIEVDGGADQIGVIGQGGPDQGSQGGAATPVVSL